MEIEEINQSNYKNCVSLFIEVFNADPWNDEWSDKAASELFQEYLGTPGFRGYAAMDGNEVAAVCLGYIRTWWDGRSFFIEELFVNGKKQNSGIGTRFIGEIETSLREEGITKVTLLTLRESAAEKFYLKNGYSNRDFLTFMRKKLV